MFYQVKKQNQRFPIAQLAGRTDFALFPVAGYLYIGNPDIPALSIFCSFTPSHSPTSGSMISQIASTIRYGGMYSITVLYGKSGTAYWIAGFSAVHACTTLLFMSVLGWMVGIGLLAGLVLLLVVNIAILQDRRPDTGLRVLPLFHITMLVYAVSILLDAVV